MGCWAVGGPFWAGEQPLGWGEVDDAESTAALRRAFELGITVYDTADVYGAGRSERVLAGALGRHRDEIFIATKWGNVFDEGTKQITGHDATPAHLRRAVEASLSRLGTDRIDLHQLHLGDASPEEAAELSGALEELVSEGKIRAYGWSTDDAERPAAMAGPHFAAVQHELNVLNDAPGMLALVEERGWTSINRGPLAMGLLSPKYTADTRIGDTDVRGDAPEWMRYFHDGRPAAEWLRRRDAVREILTSDGRTLVQGALAWIWSRSPHTLPIPGFRTIPQVEENAAALQHGPLSAGQMAEIDKLLDRG
ncbi:aldo/keto reductase [Streptomyces sp. J2-1]|uniref:aldo/keto reductase n=1 Tax=Streptomyces corallincola TaxID=2851888 RepID=UPI001C38736C|nr:aldo/keto reductase [Streptomyces corallincola]MBV2353712.1 aldo/keto reductase [Streptomyces corallincola]